MPSAPDPHGRNAEEFVYRVNDAHERPMDALVSATFRLRRIARSW